MATLSFQREAQHGQNSLVLGGMKSIPVSSMGDNMVLLKSDEPLLIEKAECRKDQWWRGLFKTVKRWLPHMVAKQRRILIRLYGLPMHVWEEQSFKKLGALFGEFLDFDEATINLSRLDMATLFVGTTSMAFINEQIRVEVMGGCVQCVGSGGGGSGAKYEEGGRIGMGGGVSVVSRRWERW